MGTDESEDQVHLVLSADEALVFFEWLARFNAAEHEFDEQAEQRVLWDLESMLESVLVLRSIATTTPSSTQLVNAYATQRIE